MLGDDALQAQRSGGYILLNSRVDRYRVGVVVRIAEIENADQS
jgi:hypothetical protein